MDLNELFFRHQIALMRAGTAGERAERSRLHEQADGFAVSIGRLQRHIGALAAPLIPAAAQ